MVLSSIAVVGGPVGVATEMSMTPLMRSPYCTGKPPVRKSTPPTASESMIEKTL